VLASIYSHCCSVALDGVVRMGRSLRDKAPQSDHDVLHDAVVQLKTKWTSLCSRAVDRFVSFGLLLCLPVYFYVFFFYIYLGVYCSFSCTVVFLSSFVWLTIWLCHCVCIIQSKCFQLEGIFSCSVFAIDKADINRDRCA